ALSSYRTDPLLLHVFRQSPLADLRAVDIALRIDREPLGAARSFKLLRIGNAVKHLPVFQAADSDAAFPSRMGRDAVRFRVSDVDRIAANVDRARPAELLPFTQEFSVLIENLHAHVAAVGDE